MRESSQGLSAEFSNNIKKRAKDLGGEASVKSELTKGATIEVSFPKG